MKKILAIIFVLCLLCSGMGVFAAENSVITTSVPNTHQITVTGDNVKVNVGDVSGEILEVDRLTETTLKIVPDKGYAITKVLYDGVDVTANVVDGKLKIEGIYKDGALTVETEKLPEKPIAPSTGDRFNLALFSLLMLVSTAMAIMLLKHKRQLN